ncbi:MAG: glycosyltransferase family 4 protein [Candidatus Pacearchaeota archaeon]
MKVCFIGPKAYPLFNSKIKSTFGGAEVQLSLLAKEIAKERDLEVHFMVADYGQENLEKRANVKIWKSINFKSSKLKQVSDFFKIFKKINADIYIQRSMTPYTGLIALYCKIKRKKFIYMVAHDNETEEKKIYKNITSKVTFRYSNKIVVQNKTQKNNLQKKKIKSYLIRIGYPIKEFKEENRNTILWVGRSEVWKRPLLFLELAKKFQNKKFIMICSESTNNKKLFISVKEKAQSLKNVKFIPFVPLNKIDNFFRKSRIFINTSVQEGFPNTFIQSAKNKTVIVSLNVNPDKRLNGIGYFCENNITKMEKLIKNIYNNKRLINKKGLNGFKYAKKNYDISLNSNKLLKLMIK